MYFDRFSAVLRPGVARALTLLCLTISAGAFAFVIAGLPAATGDYSLTGSVAGDNAAPAIAALAHLHLGALAAHQPLMGLTSLLLRAPVQLLTGSYLLGAVLCLLPACLLFAWMIMRERDSLVGALSAATVGVIALAGPVTRAAVLLGHPEEVLATVLATAAVLAAGRDRETLAAVLLGSAIGTKPWAVVAVPCVVIALPGRRIRGVLRAAAIAIPLVATLPLADLAAFERAANAVGGTHLTNPFSPWWPLSGPAPAVAGTHPVVHLLPFGLTRSSAGALTLFAAALLLGLRTWRLGGPRRIRVDALALLALLSLVRCVGDPAPLQYYFVALIFPLAAWELVGLRRLPIATCLTSLAVATLLSAAWFLRLGAGADDALFLVGAAALGTHLTVAAVGHPIRPVSVQRSSLIPATIGSR